MKITEEMSKEAYLVARKVHQGEMARNEGIRDLVDRLGMNQGSATELVHKLGIMLEGSSYQRTMNYFTTEHYIQSIRVDFGEAAYRNALSALEKHLDYYDSLGQGRHVRLRALLKKAVVEFSNAPLYPDEIDTDEALVEGSKKTVSVNAYERNPEARRRCLQQFGYICSVCGIDFENAYGDIVSKTRNNGPLRGQIARNYRPLRHEHWATRVPE
ncbi:MAG: hypothetical protein WC749_12065 [Dehalococcoidia bacterium]